MALKIRNFSIIAHIDHGKSTLSDRLIERTGTVALREMQDQLTDQMALERERGITIKLQPVAMQWTFSGDSYLLNLIDTPGHVDFSYEVSRSLAAVEGAVVLVDASQGIEAQTLAHIETAREQGLRLIPVINKIDLPNADPESVTEELMETFGFTREEIICVSAKTGQGVETLLNAIVERVPPPKGTDGESRALIFDSFYDSYRGVIAYVRIVDGVLSPHDDVRMIHTGARSTLLDCGILKPKRASLPRLTRGMIGYLVTGLKDVRSVRVGDTVTLQSSSSTVQALPGYAIPVPNVYSGVFPMDSDEYPAMRLALERLQLNDAAVSYEATNSSALGHGFRVGFLGLLHMEVVQERLEREFNVRPILTSPTVSYRVTTPHGKTTVIESPEELPEMVQGMVIEEPIAEVVILTPIEYLSVILDQVKELRGTLIATEHLGRQRLRLLISIPLIEVIRDLHDRLKSATKGYASMTYKLEGFQASELSRLDFLIGGNRVDALSLLVPREQAYTIGRRLTSTLKGVIPRQQFEIPIQAAIGSKIVARETISALRKDVTAKLYGGDVTRKRKLLEKQKQGKKRMKSIGHIALPQEAFMAILRRPSS